MSEQENLDVGRVIGLIMENPQLIEQIANLAKGQSESKDEPPKETDIPTVKQAGDTTPVMSEPTYQRGGSHTNRAHLLGALKPYVSSERAKAIDSMISIADILDMMRTR